MGIKTRFPDFFDKFKKIVFQADTKNSMEERKQYLIGNGDSISKGLLALKESKNWIALGVMLKIIEQLDINSSACFFNTTPSHDLCKNFDDNSDKIDEQFVEIAFLRSEQLFKNAQTGKEARKYLDRHRFIEKAIRLVWEIFPADPDAEWPYNNIQKADACKFIAKCYLLRSRLVLPKGSDLPEKKIEAIEKALEWLNKSGDEINDLKIEIALEKYRWEKNLSEDWLKEMINKFFHNNTFNASNSIHRVAYDRYCETKIVKNYDDAILKICKDKCKYKKDLFLPLHQAKAAYRQKNDKMKIWLKEAVSVLSGVPLSYHLWDDTVDFIKQVKGKNGDGNDWCDAAVQAWKICMQEENRLTLSVQVRWYWSRQAVLYDLAFMAVLHKKDPVLAAEIADSLKSRPTIKLVKAENSLQQKDKDVLAKFKEIETNFATDNFVSNLSDAQMSDSSSVSSTDINDIPKGCTAIHFFISLNDTGYAVILDSKNNSTIKELEIKQTWNDYKDWKAEMQQAGSNIEATSNALKKLCNTCGNMLGPVIDCIETDQIIFVPHGFLHLVPLHAAMIDNKPLFNSKFCLFLSAWSLAPDRNICSNNSENILLTKWNISDDLKKFINLPGWSNKKKEGCTPDDYINRFNSTGHAPPAILAFYCHGKGDFMNPYKSALKLDQGPLTHQTIVQKTQPKALSGTKVILTACESDLASGKSNITDEHLSIASAFLQKGASEVCGTLFKCYSDIAGDIIKKSLNSSNLPLYQIVHEIQREYFKNKPDGLYKSAAFRVMGLPVKNLVNNEEA